LNQGSDINSKAIAKVLMMPGGNITRGFFF